MTEKVERKPKIIPDESGRIRERNFDVIPSHFPGVSLLVDHGEEPNLTRADTRSLKEVGRDYFDRDETIKNLQKLQEDRNTALKKLAIDYPGLRGIRDLNTGFEVQITPETNDIFDEKLLRESLGEEASKYVHNTASITIDIDPQKVDVSKFASSLRKMLKRRGLSPEQITKQLKEKLGFRVDKGPLEKAVKSHKVSLLPGAWGKQTTVWRVTPRAITSKAEIAETGELARPQSQLE